MPLFDCRVESARDEGFQAAQQALTDGDLIVMPTDTVYGLAADAFNPIAVQKLLDAKGRGRHMPPPVLIGNPSTLDALAVDVQPWLRSMVGELWPGPLTIICRQQPSLTWDLGETLETVAIRVPDDPIARDLLARTGPLAVSSANYTGEAAAQTVEEAEAMLGELVAVYLDGGPVTSGGVPSTIVDATGATPRVVRTGGVPIERLHEFNNTIVGAGD